MEEVLSDSNLLRVKENIPKAEDVCVYFRDRNTSIYIRIQRYGP